MGRITLRLKWVRGLMAPASGPGRRRWGQGTLMVVVALAGLVAGCSGPTIPATPTPTMRVVLVLASPGSNGPVVASCQAGEVALSGGWETGYYPPIPVNLAESRRSGNGWQVTPQPNPSQPPYSPLNAVVICLSGVPGASVQERVVSQTVPANAQASASAACLPGEELVGGGFAVPPGVEVFRLIPNGNTWAGFVVNLSGGVASVQFDAECLSAPRAQSFVVPGLLASLPAGQADTTDADCPSGAFVSGGGFVAGVNSTDPALSATFNLHGWLVFLYAEPAFGPQTFQSYAVCLRFRGVPITPVPLPTPTPTPTPAPNATMLRVSQTITIPAGVSTGSVTATCPAGTQLLSGGYAAPVLQDATADYPSSATSWTAGSAYQTPFPRTLTVHADCVRANFAVAPQVVHSAVTSIPALSTGSVTVTCPAGTTLTGGGYLSSNQPGNVVPTTLASQPAGNGWQVTAIEYSSSSSATEEAFAICTNSNLSAAAGTSASQTVTYGSGSQVDLQATCGSGLLVGGGYSTGAGVVNASQALASFSSWEVQLRDGGPAPPGPTYQVTAYAVCVQLTVHA